MKAQIKTWKMGTDRYLHEIEASGVWFHIVTDSSYYYPTSLTLRNKIFSKRSTKEVRGLKEVRHFENKIELLDKDWGSYDLEGMIIWS